MKREEIKVPFIITLDIYLNGKLFGTTEQYVVYNTTTTDNSIMASLDRDMKYWSEKFIEEKGVRINSAEDKISYRPKCLTNQFKSEY